MKLQKILLYGFLLLLLNTVYLAAKADPTIFYMTNVLFHLGFGLLLLVLFSIYIAKHFRSMSLIGKLATVSLIAGVLFGILLMWTGAHRPYRWILHWHIGITSIGSLLLIVYLFQRVRHTKWTSGRLASALAVTVFLPAIVLSYQRGQTASTDRIVNPKAPPASMFQEGDGPKGPFFPSSAQTNTGGKIPSNFFMTSDMCGRCHVDIYKQWFSSAHHFSSFNNQWYRKSIEYMQDVIGTKPSKWCGGCHDHAVIFNGMMDTPIKEIIDTPEAQAGLSCTSCHSIVHVKSSMGQGDFVIEYPPLHDLAASDNKFLEKLHDFLVFTDPEPHKKTFMKPFIRQDMAEYCSACHKVHLDVPVNNYRWSRGFNEYDNWQASGISGQGARSFYYPPNPMKCGDCHMPLVDAKDPAAINGKVHSHRFPGANTALPHVNRDQEQFKVVEDFLKADQVTVDIFAYSKAIPIKVTEKESTDGPKLQSMFAVGEESASYGASSTVIREPVEVVAPLDKVDATVARGDTIRLDVVVRTRRVGHFFPGGTVDAFDVWLELQATDDTGRVIFWSGKTEDYGKERGPVEKGAHFYRSLLLDEHGNRINKRNAWAARSVAYVRLIPPGAAETVHFRMQIPPDVGSKIHLKAKLNYRKFAWWNTNWAFAGIRDPEHKDFALGKAYDDGRWIFKGDTSHVSGKIKAIPDLPIVVMSQDEVVLKVADKASARRHEADPLLRERWNDYGIGLLLQGDLRAAEMAFRKVTELDPNYADGWVNIARARIQEGNMMGAQEMLKKAFALAPDLAKTHFFFGLTLKAQGKYDNALHHLQKAAEKYPRDRVVRNQIGRILFLQRKHEDAIAEFEKTLLIDPEDLQAHYNLMLCYQGLGNQEMAEKEKVYYERFKADETSQTITGQFRKLNPEDNNERQPIHEHTSAH
ncbi:tetratricopeptide repeat protein [bacterium]|nr:tetratricopeptide repeat protein [bacterium]